MTKLFNQLSTGIIVLVLLFFWDNKKEEEQLAQISRDETLSRLPLRLSTNRIVELVQLRDTARPVSVNDFPSLRLLMSNVGCILYKAENKTLLIISRVTLHCPS